MVLLVDNAKTKWQILIMEDVFPYFESLPPTPSVRPQPAEYGSTQISKQKKDYTLEDVERAETTCW